MVNPRWKTLTDEDCKEVRVNFGENWEQNTAVGLNWFALILSLAFVAWYTKQTIGKKCGWEEFYVAIVESTPRTFVATPTAVDQ